MTFWVPLQASNTVEGRQVRARGRQPERRTRACSGTPRPRRSTRPALTSGRNQVGAPMQDLVGTANLSAPRHFWTPQSAAPVEFSVANAGTLGIVKVARAVASRDQHGAGPDRHASSAAAPDPTSTRSTPARAVRQPLLAPAARRRTAARRSTASPASSRSRTRRSPTRSAATSRRRAAATPAATRSCRRGAAVRRRSRRGDREAVLVHRRSRPLHRPRAQRATTSSSPPPAPGTYTPGRPYTLSGVKFAVTLPAVMLKGLYGNLVNYESLPADGNVDQPLRIWVAVAGHGHHAGRADVLIEGRWHGRLQRSGRHRRQGDESFRTSSSSYTLPDDDVDAVGQRAAVVLGRRAGPDPGADPGRLRPQRRRGRGVPDEPVRQRLRARRDGPLRREHRLPRGHDRLRQRRRSRARTSAALSPDDQDPDAGRRGRAADRPHGRRRAPPAATRSRTSPRRRSPIVPAGHGRRRRRPRRPAAKPVPRQGRGR